MTSRLRRDGSLERVKPSHPVASLLFLVVAACGGRVDDSDASAPDASGGDASGSDAAHVDAAKPPQCVLAASTYGTKCAISDDCASVFVGNACTSSCLCANGVIAKSGLAQYQSDLASIDAGGIACPCPPPLPPSCCDGECSEGPCP